MKSADNFFDKHRLPALPNPCEGCAALGRQWLAVWAPVARPCSLLKTFRAISFVRLAGMFDEVFGLKLSQGTLAKMLKRSHQPF